MRADRLLSLLMLLQRQGELTVAQAAAALEVSERTARRDLEALGVAGVPVYAVRGRGGGWRLVGGARTDLTGLTGPEVRALFLAAGSAPGRTPAVRAALDKLRLAVPTTFREDAGLAAETALVDVGEWGGAPAEVPAQLAAAQDAVAGGRRVELSYRDRTGADTVRVVDPLGLVNRGTAWYLVADTASGRRTFRVDRATSILALDERVRRPDDFDLATAWAELAAQIQTRRFPAHVTGRVRPWALRVLLRFRMVAVTAIGPDEDEWHRVEIAGYSTVALAGLLAGFGGALRLDGPDEVRERLARIGRELVAQYGDAEFAPGDPFEQ